MAYSSDLRQRVLDYCARGGSKVQAAELFQVHLRTVFLWLEQGAGHIPRKPGPKDSRKFSRDKLVRLVARQPDALLRELAEQVGVQSPNTISHALKRLKISRKKNAAVSRSL